MPSLNYFWFFLYISETIHCNLVNVPIKSIKLKNCCHNGTPNGIRISITTGEVKGMKENTVETVPCGSSITVKTPT